MAKSTIASLKMSDATALRFLEQVAHSSDSIKLTAHAGSQMRKRGIGLPLVRECLRRGTITESPVMDFNGNWLLRIERYAAGSTVGCAVALDVREPKATIITAFWVK